LFFQKQKQNKKVIPRYIPRKITEKQQNHEHEVLDVSAARELATQFMECTLMRETHNQSGAT
jgi:hypothetical protein